MSIGKLWRYALFIIWALYALGAGLALFTLFTQGFTSEGALAAYQRFSWGFMIPVGALTLILISLQQKVDPAEQRAFQKDERRITVSNRAISVGFWILLFGMVFSFAIFSDYGLTLPAMLLTLIIMFAAFLGVATQDELAMARLEAQADD